MSLNAANLRCFKNLLDSGEIHTMILSLKIDSLPEHNQLGFKHPVCITHFNPQMPKDIFYSPTVEADSLLLLALYWQNLFLLAMMGLEVYFVTNSDGERCDWEVFNPLLSSVGIPIYKPDEFERYYKQLAGVIPRLEDIGERWNTYIDIVQCSTSPKTDTPVNLDYIHKEMAEYNSLSPSSLSLEQWLRNKYAKSDSPPRVVSEYIDDIVKQVNLGVI